MSKNVYAIDIEATGLDRHEDELVLAGVYDAFNDKVYQTRYEGDYLDYHEKKDLTNELVIVHNGAYDIPFLELHTGAKFKNYIDTMIMAYFYDPYEKRYGLEYLVEKHFGVTYGVDLDVKTKFSQENLEYNEKDIKFTYMLYQFYESLLSTRELELVKLFSRISVVYAGITERGVLLDTDMTERALAEYDSILKKLEREILEEIGEDININSSAQLGEVLYEKLGHPVRQWTKSGKPSVGVKALAEINTPLTKKILEYKKAFKLVSSFLKPYSGKEKIYPSFKVTSTVSGRTSSANPNLQQIPQGAVVRNLLSAPEGYYFVEADYSQMELRGASEIAGVEAMHESYVLGEDIHMRTGNLVANDGLKATDRDPDVNDQLRQQAKAVNFGFLYGMSAETFVEYAHDSYGVDFTLKQARIIRRDFFTEYYQLNQYYKDIEKEVEKYGYIENPLGRRRRVFPEQRGKGYDSRSFINSKIQGFASDHLLLALLEISELPEYNKSFQVIGTIHDAILMYVKKEEVHILYEIKRIMEKPKYVKELMGSYMRTPVEADVDIWDDRWYGSGHKSIDECVEIVRKGFYDRDRVEARESISERKPLSPPKRVPLRPIKSTQEERTHAREPTTPTDDKCLVCGEILTLGECYSCGA